MGCLSLFLTHTHKSHMSMKHVYCCRHPCVGMLSLWGSFNNSPLNTSSFSSVSARTETTTYSRIEAVPAEICCAYLYNIKRDILTAPPVQQMSHIREDPAGGQAANSPTAEIFFWGSSRAHKQKCGTCLNLRDRSSS